MPRTQASYESVIFAPVFRETQYIGHRCSGCAHDIQLSQSVFGKIFYPSGEKLIRFCPHCGKPVIRFDEKVIYEKAVDFAPLIVFQEEVATFKRKLRWLYWCILSKQQHDDIDKVLPFAKDFEYLADTVKAVQYAKPKPGSWQAVEKLRKEFGATYEGP